MAEDVSEQPGFFASLIGDIIYSPINCILLGICIFLIHQIFKTSRQNANPPPPPQRLAKLKKQDMTLAELRKYDGSNTDGRVCIGINGKVFDVTRGKKFYGPGGPYAAFAGHDATRCFANFSVQDVKEDHDDISDLTYAQMESVREWEAQFYEKYDYVGRLLKPGEVANEYSEDEDPKTEKKEK